MAASTPCSSSRDQLAVFDDWALQISQRYAALTYGENVDRFVEAYGIGPVRKRAGRREGFPGPRTTYICCPFHKDRSPSFVIWAYWASWSCRNWGHCFGCQWSGDLGLVAARLRGVKHHPNVMNLDLSLRAVLRSDWLALPFGEDMLPYQLGLDYWTEPDRTFMDFYGLVPPSVEPPFL